jgi:16S rRNA processing protein RimM
VPELLDVGRVVRPHGLRGLVVVEMWTNRPERVEAGAELRAGGRAFVVDHASRLADVGGQARWLMSLAGVSDREAAEGLRDTVLQARPLEDDDALWVHDLIGAEVRLVDGTVVGSVQSVEANPASDLMVLGDGKLVPLRFITEHEPGLVTVDVPDGLFDL